MRFTILSALTASAMSVAIAYTPNSANAESLETVQLVSNCLVCHNDHVDDIPDPRGFSNDAITKALQSFRDGSREGTIMNRIARGFDDGQIAIIAKSLSKM